MSPREAGPLPSKSAAYLADYSTEPEELPSADPGPSSVPTPAMTTETSAPRNLPARRPPSSRNKVPPAGGCVGRDTEQSRLLYALLEEGSSDGAPSGAQAAAIYGIAGSGKTNLMLSVLNDPRTKERYGKSVFYIDCRAATDAVRLAAVLFDALSSDPRAAFRNATIDAAGFASPATLARLDDNFDLLDVDGPALVALDNLEAAFEHHPWTIEDILVRLLERATVFIAMRDCVLPSVGRRWNSIRLGNLTGAGGRDAFGLHCGDFSESHDATEVDGLVELVGGHALSLGLLGRLAAGSGGDIAELESIWKRELTRPTGPRDTPRNHLPSCLDISLQAASMTPLAIQLMLAASRLPLSVSVSGGTSTCVLAGLPRSLADKVCAAHDAADQASDTWSLLRRNGILAISTENPHKLDLVPPIRTYLSHRANAELDPKTEAALEAWTSELDERLSSLPEPSSEPSQPLEEGQEPPPIRRTLGMEGTFETLLPALHARMALQRFCGNDRQANEIEAFSCVLEADCTDSGEAALVLRKKSVRLFRLCKMEFDAILEDAKAEDILADQAENVSDWTTAIKHREAAVTLWTKTGRENMAIMTEAQVSEAHARMAVDANELVAAIEHRMNAMNLWSQGGNQPRAQINEAQMCELKACIAANNADQEEAARMREEGSRLWYLVGKTGWGDVEKAKALKIRGKLMFEQSRLEEALEIFEEEVAKYKEVEDEQEIIWGETAIASIKSRLAGAAGELAMAAELLAESETLWAKYDATGETNPPLGGFNSHLYHVLIAMESDSLTPDTVESAAKAVEGFPVGDTENRAVVQAVGAGIQAELDGQPEDAADKYEQAADQESESTPPYREDIFVKVLRKRIAKCRGVEYVEPDDAIGAEKLDTEELAGAEVEVEAPEAVEQDEVIAPPTSSEAEVKEEDVEEKQE